MSDSFGLDITTFVNGTPGMDPMFGTVSGPQAVEEVVARMLMDDLLGIDLANLVGVQMTSLRRARIIDAVETALTNDERVVSAKVQSLTEISPGRFKLVLRADVGAGPFTLVLAISQVTVELLRAA